MFTAKIAHVLKMYLPTPVIEAMLSYRIGYIRLKGSWMVKKLVIKLEIKTCVCVLYLSVLYYNIESKKFKIKAYMFYCYLTYILFFLYMYILISY